MIAKIITILIGIPTAYFCVTGTNPWLNAALLFACSVGLWFWGQALGNEQSRGNGTERQ